MKESTIKYIKNGLFIVFTIIISTYIILEVFAPNKTIDVFGYKSYIVITSSMEPDIMVNDMIIIRRVDEEALHTGDAITFDVYLSEVGHESKVTHYIGDIQTVGNGTIYKTLGATADPGDYDVWRNANNDIIDITYEDIEGRVILTIPYIGHVVNVLRDPISLGFIAINLTIIYFLVKLIKKPKEEEIEETK